MSGATQCDPTQRRKATGNPGGGEVRKEAGRSFAGGGPINSLFPQEYLKETTAMAAAAAAGTQGFKPGSLFLRVLPSLFQSLTAAAAAAAAAELREAEKDT